MEFCNDLREIDHLCQVLCAGITRSVRFNSVDVTVREKPWWVGGHVDFFYMHERGGRGRGRGG